jgi:AcrR family transcriptional regulator
MLQKAQAFVLQIPRVSTPTPIPTGDDRLDGSPAYRAAMALGPDQAPRPASPAAAFLAARDRYLAGERLDMRSLAAQLGVSRPTLYRWTGSREQLLADVLFSISDAVFTRAIEDTRMLSGPDRLLAVFRRHVEAIVSSASLQAFLRQETQVALRILTARHGSVTPRTVRRVAELYRSEAQAGHFTARADVDTLAFAVVCLAESFIYNDASAAVAPESEVDRAVEVIRLLLGA